MLYLNEKEIHKAITMEEMIDAIDYCYSIYSTERFQMPTRSQVLDGVNTLLVMPAITTQAISTKLVTSFPKNLDYPSIQGLVILNCIETGRTKAILDGSCLTAIRTGAIGGSAIRHLVKKSAHAVAIIGTGLQGLYQAIAAVTAIKITDIYLYNRTNSKLKPFVTSLRNQINSDINIHSMESVEEAILNADIIITATSSITPVLPANKSLLGNKLIIGIGSFQPRMRELPEAAFHLTNQIIIDSDDAIKETGDLQIPLSNKWISQNQIQTMSSHLTNNHSPNYSDNNSIIFKSTGMALFDNVAAVSIYEKALQKGVGQKLI
ncbi:ornithine cyclodeaminase family protein [Virgibacillus halodenitrificans]|uniref:ornithine cyclodeaminase family protein n=1 Tax=Virgibacillus halodenitrificans TaxID=1482 RepID=UPI001FB30FD4|nr:ornithine cyclodeaminase family protein [Virgibacillus halodenitrificans]MCJ0931386.1 ornithine cyclodeaminase family protein [Virgibacillus halodenitrificans]